METGDTRQDIVALFALVQKIGARQDEVFRRLYSDPAFPGSHGDIPAIIKQQQEIHVRCIEHARCLAEDKAAIQGLRVERKRWMRNAKWALWLAVGSGGGSALWVAIRDFLLGK